MARKKKPIDVSYVDLVLDSGELVQITYPDCDIDEVFESLQYAMKIGEWWSPMRFGDHCEAIFMGMRLDRVNMKRVIGML